MTKKIARASKLDFLTSLQSDTDPPNQQIEESYNYDWQKEPEPQNKEIFFFMVF